MKKSLISFSLIFIFLGLNLSIISFLGFPFTSATVFVTICFFSIITKFNKNKISNCIFVLIYFLIIAFFNFESVDFFEFVKTFLLCSVFFTIFFHSLNDDISNVFSYLKILSGPLILVIFSFEFIQVFEQLFLGSHHSWFFLDPISTSTAVDPIRFKSSLFQSYIRPISFFYEPSYLGFVLFLLTVANHELGGRRFFTALGLFGILLTVSSVSYIFSFIYFFVRFCPLNRKGGLLLLLFFVVFLLFDGYHFFRLEELTWIGTSGYERITKPLLATIDYLSNFPFGLPLGQSSFLYNNSFFLFILYFGFTSFLLIPAYFLFIYNNVDSTRKCILYFVSLSFLLNLNGSIFTFEGAFFISSINYIFMVYKEEL
ncbi:hypothetical protein GNP73_00230 [Aliivibrio fischeri]|uniref:hypothetical protein n=1 Tax=Aliivibrio fischeri TaxID=668 RepID=UPI0012DACFA3|nr:hypothetical protein [Aliivibrio fischeri]MUJ26411.1 hypothetical protein [Aliivibrio fischeri]